MKHRIGLDKSEDTPQSYAFVRDFMGAVADAGCQTFIVHARNAWLEGLSPKENRDIPPLRYEVVHRLKQDFPHLNIVINGGITTNEQIAQQLQQLDGVMLGREAYHNPWLMATWDAQFYGANAPSEITRESIEEQMVQYMDARKSRAWHTLASHRAPHAGLAPRFAWCAALAAGVEQPKPARLAAV